MEINKKYILKRMRDKNWSQADLARAMEVTPATVSRILKGTRGPGKEVVAGLLKAFPDADISELFFLDRVSPNDDIEKEHLDHKTA